jgi:hypothetical protein
MASLMLSSSLDDGHLTNTDHSGVFWESRPGVKLGTVAHVCNSSTLEAEARGSLESRSLRLR